MALTDLEQRALKALIVESETNGNDFGILECVAWDNREQLGGLVTSLQKKGVIESIDVTETNGGPKCGGERLTQYVLTEEVAPR